MTSAVINKFSNLAEAVHKGESANGRLSWIELAVETDAQLCDVLRKANEEKSWVFRGRTDERVEKTAAFCTGRNGTPGGTASDSTALFLDLSRLASITEHIREDQVISVQTGISLGKLAEHLAHHGQWLPLEFSRHDLLLADVIDTGDGGFLETCFGGVKQLVLGMHLSLMNGTSIKTGGKIVKNVTGYDLAKVFVGSRSWLAIPHMVHLRLYSKPETTAAMLVPGQRPQDLISLAAHLISTGLPIHCLECFDTRLAHKNEEVAQLSEGFNCALVISTKGQNLVVREVSSSIQRKVEESGFEVRHLFNDRDGSAERLCSDLVDNSKRPTLELNLPPSAMIYFFQTWWMQNGKPPWHARVGSGRLRLDSDGVDQRSSLETFANLLQKDGFESFAFAHSSPRYEFQVSRLPNLSSVSALDGVMSRLKRQFDPLGCLNPLVRFTTDCPIADDSISSTEQEPSKT